jgi:mono/diheme cytochrome c family protein
MLLVGWVAINENARMRSFERQYQARAIERGAEIFAATCTGCHGVDGRGILGFAPALNNPQLFGYDYFAGINSGLGALDDEEAALQAERTDLAAEYTDPETSEDRQTEIDERLNEISERLNGPEGITAERQALFDQRDQLIVDLQPAVAVGYPLRGLTTDDETGELILDYDPTRLGQLNWGGTLDAFIFTTLIHGRPTSISYWGGNQMVSWSQRGTGPMRDDELRDLVAYILNWDKGEDWTLADAFAVNQYARVPGLGGDAGAVDAAGTNVEEILTQMDTLVGNAADGEALYGSSLLGCAGCHLQEVNGPLTAAKWDDTITNRLTLEQFAGYTVEQYLVESIVQPGAYTVPGYTVEMPDTFDDRMSVQDIADVLAYLHTFSELDPYVPPVDTGEAEATAEPGAEVTEEPADTGDVDAEATEVPADS